MICFFFNGCNNIKEKKVYPYEADKNLTYENGLPVNDTIFFFPIEVFIDTIKLADGMEIKKDTSSVEWYSRDLHFLKEPVLYNFYLNKDIYRFTWLRSFHPPIVLRLEKSNNEVTLTEKKLIKFESIDTLGRNEFAMVLDSIHIEESKRKVDNHYWNDFESLLKENNFQDMPTTVAWEFGTDGSEWILEKHSKEGYYVVNRWSPYEKQYANFRKICDYLIDHSKFKDEERY